MVRSARGLLEVGDLLSRRGTTRSTPLNRNIGRTLSFVLRLKRGSKFAIGGINDLTNRLRFNRNRRVINMLYRISMIPRKSK